MFDELFIKRSHCLGYQLTDNEENNHGWVGGNAPEWFDDKPQLLTNDGNHKYGFFLSLRLPVSETMLSIFIPEEFSVYSKAKYPCGVKAFEHPVSIEGKTDLYRLMPEKPKPDTKPTNYQRKFDYSIPVIKKTFIAPYTKYSEDRPFEDFIQFGGSPAWIQDEEEYYANDLLKMNYQYIMQINEEKYLPSMIHGNDPFCFGALYVYGQIKENSLSDITAAFWQNS